MKSKTEPWYATPQVIVSLRPQAGHESVRAAARRRDARVLSLSPWKLIAREDAATREDLRAALNAPRVLFTSPAAVQFACVLMPLQSNHSQTFLSVGSGTARVLQRAGIERVVSPKRMDSEGFLALAETQTLRDSDFGLVSAPDGRDLITQTLIARGARILRADVYERKAIPLSEKARQQLRTLQVPARVLLSSAAALDLVLQQLAADEARVLRQLPSVAASERIANLARAAGFAHVRTAAGPLPAQMLQTAFAATEG